MFDSGGFDAEVEFGELFEGGVDFFFRVGEAGLSGEGHEFLLDGDEFLFGAFHL